MPQPDRFFVVYEACQHVVPKARWRRCGSISSVACFKPGRIMHGCALAESGWGAENKTQRRWEHDTCLPHFTINLSAKITPRLFLHTALQHKHTHARAHRGGGGRVVGRGSKVEGEGERGEGGRDRTRLLADHSSPHTHSVSVAIRSHPGKTFMKENDFHFCFLNVSCPYWTFTQSHPESTDSALVEQKNTEQESKPSFVERGPDTLQSFGEKKE